ncbi:hypothetical protein [Cupriavidus pauculus]|uniref:hypothetical protein n=1 Tax=Cupriavidus pauculus TaxID=82633 RepID=UPI0038579B1C
MLEGRVIWLSDADFIPERIDDQTLPVQFRLKPEAFDASLSAHVVLWRGEVVKNVVGPAGQNR